MSFARDQYSATAAQTNFTITFAYINTADIVVVQEGATLTEVTDYTISGSTMTLVVAATEFDVVVLTRSTSQTTRLTDYTVPSSLTEADLDNDSLQAFYMAQESIDRANLSLGREASGVDWDAESLLIHNLTDPLTDQDAATKAYADLAATSGGNIPQPNNPGEDNYTISASGGTFAWQSPATMRQRLGGIVQDLDTLGAATADGEFLVATAAGVFAYETGETAGTSMGAAIGDLVTLGAASADGEFIVATAAGVFAYESGSTVAQSIGGITQDLDTLGAPTADGEMIVASAAGVFAYETGATLRTSIGAAGLADANTFTAANVFNDDLTMAAVSGVLETNATFVDMVIFGPALDPKKDWHKPLGASVATELMLATIEDLGTATELNIWDLTDPTIASATPLATVTVGLEALTAPTSIAASMGYLIIGGENGVQFFSPHQNGTWEEHTTGWPHNLSAGTVPALSSNSVSKVSATITPQARFDPRTGGPRPSFRIGYATSTIIAAVYKDNGEAFDDTYTSGITDAQAEFYPGRFATFVNNDILQIVRPLEEMAATADWQDAAIGATGYPGHFTGVTAMDGHNGALALGGTGGLDLMDVSGFGQGGSSSGGQANFGTRVGITRAFNTGTILGDNRGAWLANSKTVDRGPKGNTLSEAGTVTEAAVAAGAELKGYSGWNGVSARVSRGSDADYDVAGTTAFSQSIWFKSAGNSVNESLMGFANAGNTIEFLLVMNSDGTILAKVDGATATVTVATAATYDDDVWHKADMVRGSSTDLSLYVDGVLIGNDTTDQGSISDSTNLPFAIGVHADGTTTPALTNTLSLAHMSATDHTAAQIKSMYEAERPMFEVNAKCLLQSGTTDAVIDVNVDKINGKVAVTQTDDVVVFDGLVISDEPTIAAGGTTWEHYHTYGDDVVEINDANAFASVAAKDLRSELESLRGERLPKGPDLSRAKAWAHVANDGTITGGFNIKSVTKPATGRYVVTYDVPFKNEPAKVATQKEADSGSIRCTFTTGSGEFDAHIRTFDSANVALDNAFFLVCYGELENE